MSITYSEALGNRILIAAAAVVSMVVTLGISLFVSRDIWQVVFPAVVAFPYVFLIFRMVIRDRLGALDRGLSRGLGWTHVGMWILLVVSAVWQAKTPAELGYLLYLLALLALLSPFGLISILFLLSQVMLIRADGQIGMGRDFWMGFALPSACAVAAIGGIHTKREIWIRRDELQAQQRREEADRPRREAAEARARALQALPRAEVSWKIDLGEGSEELALARGADGEVYVTADDRIIVIRRPRGIRWSIPSPVTIEPAAPGANGLLYVGAREHSSPTDEFGPGKLLALDSRGERMWSADVCGSHPYAPLVTSSDDVVVPCRAPDRHSQLKDRLLTAISVDGHVRWSVTGAAADGAAAIAHDTTYVVGRSVVDAPGVHKHGPQQLFAIDRDGRTRWTAPTSSSRGLVVVFGDLIVVQDRANELKAFDSRGGLQWIASVPGRYLDAMVKVNDMIVAASESTVDAFGVDGNLRWQFDIHSVTNSYTDRNFLSAGRDGAVYLIRRSDVIALQADGTLEWIYIPEEDVLRIAPAGVPVEDGIAVAIRDDWPGYHHRELTLLRRAAGNAQSRPR